jgi:hypothetical protein
MNKTTFEIKFDAVLSKNDIARKIKEMRNDKEMTQNQFDYIFERLKDIEEYIGIMNQPSIEDILESPFE